MQDYNVIMRSFRDKYKHLIPFGLQIHGIANLIDDYDVISVTTPFIFDRRKLPKEFMGLSIRSSCNAIPEDFENISSNVYLWAYQRFEKYVDSHAGLIRATLKDETLIKKDMLDALCFGDFEAHKANCIQWEAEGKIPKWKE